MTSEQMGKLFQEFSQASSATASKYGGTSPRTAARSQRMADLFEAWVSDPLMQGAPSMAHLILAVSLDVARKRGLGDLTNGRPRLATWMRRIIDREGREGPITLNDIVIITLYNAQVFEIQQCLPGARVGTVDKFQGQEAPIAIYSTATSSHADAPRGMEFLYSLNRLNVATSRAKCVSILVGSPQIFEAECRTPQQIQLANAFCRYLEMAKCASSA
jgi:hypothetical protein